MTLTRRRFALAALTLPAACATPAPPPAAAPAPYARARTIILPPVQGLAFTSDDTRILVASDEERRIHVYAQAGRDSGREKLSENAGSHAFPLSCFPHDDRVLLRTIPDDIRARLVVRGDGGDLHDLTGDVGLDARLLGWRADGGAFWVATERGDRSTVYEIDSDSYAVRMIYDTEGRIDAVSADGAWLALTAYPDVFVVHLNQPADEPRPVVRLRRRLQRPVFEFARDGRSLVYADDTRAPHVEAWRYDLASGAQSPVMQAQADVLGIYSSPSGRHRVYETGAEAIADVLIVDQQTDRTFPLPGGVRDIRFNRAETQILYRRADDPWPQDIFVSDLNGEGVRRVVHAPNADD